MDPAMATTVQAATRVLGKVGWQSCAGWLSDLPGLRPATVLAACVPEPTAVLSVAGAPVLVATGTNTAAGIPHAAVVLPCGRVELPQLQNCGGLAPWLAGLPAGALVLVALVDMSPEQFAKACTSLSATFPGTISAAPPGHCRVAAFVGRKAAEGSGKANDDCETMAAADFAMATMAAPDPPSAEAEAVAAAAPAA